MDAAAILLDERLAHRRYLTRVLRLARIQAEACPCFRCAWGLDVARSALFFWDVRLLGLVPAAFKQEIHALR